MKRRVEAIGEIFETDNYSLLPKILNDDELIEWLGILRDAGIIGTGEYELVSTKSADDIAIYIEDLVRSGKYRPTLVDLPSSVVSDIKEYISTVRRTPKPENVLKEAEMIQKALGRAQLYKLAEKMPEYFKLLELIEEETWVGKAIKGKKLTDAITGEEIKPGEMLFELPDGSVTKYENWEKYLKLSRKYPELSMYDIFELIREQK